MFLINAASQQSRVRKGIQSGVVVRQLAGRKARWLAVGQSGQGGGPAALADSAADALPDCARSARPRCLSKCPVVNVDKNIKEGRDMGGGKEKKKHAEESSWVRNEGGGEEVLEKAARNAWQYPNERPSFKDELVSGCRDNFGSPHASAAVHLFRCCRQIFLA